MLFFSKEIEKALPNICRCHCGVVRTTFSRKIEVLSVLERRWGIFVGSDRSPSSLGCGRLCLGEVRSDRGGGEEEESAEDGLGNEGVAEEHPSGLVLRKARPKGLSEAAPGFQVEWIEGPAQGVGEEVKDDG